MAARFLGATGISIIAPPLPQVDSRNLRSRLITEQGTTSKLRYELIVIGESFSALALLGSYLRTEFTSSPAIVQLPISDESTGGEGFKGPCFPKEAATGKLAVSAINNKQSLFE